MLSLPLASIQRRQHEQRVVDDEVQHRVAAASASADVGGLDSDGESDDADKRKDARPGSQSGRPWSRNPKRATTMKKSHRSNGHEGSRGQEDDERTVHSGLRSARASTIGRANTRHASGSHSLPDARRRDDSHAVEDGKNGNQPDRHPGGTLAPRDGPSS